MGKYLLFEERGLGYDHVKGGFTLKNESSGRTLSDNSIKNLANLCFRDEKWGKLADDDELTTIPAPTTKIKSGMISIPVRAEEITEFHRVYHQAAKGY